MKDVPAFLLLVTILTPGPPRSPGTALAHSCTADEIITGAEEVKNISSVYKKGEKGLNITLYVHRETGFIGVSVVVKVTGGGGEANAWFPLNDTCFPDDEWCHWCVVWAQATLTTQPNVSEKKSTSHTNEDKIIKLQVRTSECHDLCVQNFNFDSIESLQVRGHGASQWRDKSCGEIKDRKGGTWEGTFPSCQPPPPPPVTAPPPHLETTSANPPKSVTTPATTTLSTTPISSTTPTPATKPTPAATPTKDPTPPSSVPIKVVAGIAAGVGVVLVVGIVSLVVCLRRRDDARPEDVPMQQLNTEPTQEDHGAVGRRDSTNSIYEPFNRQDITNSIYEPLKKQESVNSIYEPFQRRDTGDSTNSLYEPCQNFHEGQYECK